MSVVVEGGVLDHAECPGEKIHQSFLRDHALCIARDEQIQKGDEAAKTDVLLLFIFSCFGVRELLVKQMVYDEVLHRLFNVRVVGGKFDADPPVFFFPDPGQGLFCLDTVVRQTWADLSVEVTEREKCIEIILK